ncbi:MAG TPA: DUF6328 family protein [Solirubrobacteraceae bacterium]|jgi:hypothetical protein|nr:DUF6328 family protein [Solirubrobacteraceae bacterium]
MPEPGNGPRPGGDARRDETEHERLDRNLDELTGELRVMVTGVQVLFAFLLIVPFNSGFKGIGGFERTIYIVTLLLAALAAVCTIAPSAQHRFLFRHDDKRYLVFASNRVVIAGMAFLALAMCGCVLLVTTKLFGAGWGVLTAALTSVPFLLLWFAIPMRRAATVSDDGQLAQSEEASSAAFAAEDGAERGQETQRAGGRS